ncbi:MAG: trigger factor [Myxococcales bacterium]|nr:trigger factor [Myxococcales bacterium]
MSVQVEKISPIKTRVTLTIEAAAVSQEMEKVFKQVRHEARIPGFRPGKAPIAMVKRRFGAYAEEEVKHNLVNERLPQVLEEQKIRLLGRPELEKEELDEAGNLVVSAVMETWPDIELGEYKGLEIKREKAEVMPQAVDTRLDMMREQLATHTDITDRDTAEAADHVRIDFKGTKNGEAVRGGAHENFLLDLGSHTFIPGFAEGVVGMKVGETKVLSLEYPAGAGREDLAGQTVDYEVILKAIVKKELPNLDDEFAHDTGQADTLEELRQKIHDDILAGEEARTRRNARKEVIAKLTEKFPIEVPPAMVDRQIEHFVRNYKIELAMAGIPIQRDASLDEELRKRFADDAKKEVMSYFLFQAIADKEGIAITDDDLEARYEKMAAEQKRSVAEVAAYYQKENMVEYLRDELLDERIVDLLLAHAQTTWEEPVVHVHDHDHDHDHDHHDHDHEAGEKKDE